LISKFESCHKFISSALSTGTGVYVHCSAGVSRSTTVVISYLMAQQHMTFENAFQFVKEKHPPTCPNAGFRKQLQDYEAILSGGGRKSGHSKKASCTIS